MTNNEDGRYDVVISYSTMASSKEEAVRLAREAVTRGNGGYVEIFHGGAKEALSEGDIQEYADDAPGMPALK